MWKIGEWLKGKLAGWGAGEKEPQPAETPTAAGAPFPMLDTGGHMAMINAVAFTPDGRQLVSASDDKTIRVWDIASGKTVRVIRGEAGAGDAGKVYAMALSPDGKWLAAGGFFDGHDAIRLYDFASGRLATLLKGHENVVSGLAFSPDGQRLISGSFDTTAIVWDVAAGKALRPLRGHRDTIYAVGFTPDGTRTVTGSDDCDLRLWSAEDGALLKTMTGHRDMVRSLAASSDGRIASGDRSGEIRLWDGLTGAFLTTLARQETVVGALGFSPDGKTLLSGTELGPGGNDCHVYDVTSGREITTYREHDNNISAAAISPDGRWAATGGGANHDIHIWDLRTGARRQGLDGQPLTLGGTGRPVWAAGFSADSRQIAWGNLWTQSSPVDRAPLQRALALPSGQAAPSGAGELEAEAASSFRRAETRHGDWSLGHRKGGNYGGDAFLDVKQGGKVWASIERDPTDGYGHSAYSFTPDGGTVISGGENGVLSAYDLNGEKRGEFTGHEGDVCAIAPSPDGRYLVSGADDQTVRLWNLKSRELLVTLFHGSDGEWVMWTPQGYYVCSPGGDKLIGWQINHGPDKEADYVRASQLARRLYRPDVIARAIELASATAALRELDAPANIIDSLRVNRPPEFDIILPRDGARMEHSPTNVIVRVAPNNDPVQGFELSVNGRQIAPRDARSLARSMSGAFDRDFDVPLEKGENRIRIAARNDIGETARELLLHFTGRNGHEMRGVLYVVAVGVDDYANFPHASLRFAGADALAFRDIMAKHAKALHTSFESLVLAKGGDREPTRANIEDALFLFREARPEDTVALFIAGHGTNEGPGRLIHGKLPKDALRHTEDYLFLPQDTATEGGQWKPSTVVRWLTFQNALQNARGRRLMFVDTCHSGGAFNPRLVKDAHDAEIIVFSATDANTQALEMKELGHGVFTYALTQGLSGAAADHNGDVELFALQSYVARRVKNLTNNVQAPAIHLSGVKDFIISRKSAP